MLKAASRTPVPVKVQAEMRPPFMDPAMPPVIEISPPSVLIVCAASSVVSQKSMFPDSAMPQMPPASAVPVGSLPHDADTEPVKEQCSMAPEPGRVFMASS